MRLNSYLMAGLVLLAGIGPVQADERGEAELGVVLQAFLDGDWSALRGVVTPEFSADWTDDALSSLAAPLRDRLAKGYTLDLLGTLTQDGFPVHIWGVSFEGEEDSVLIRVVILDGKIAGLLITPPFV